MVTAVTVTGKEDMNTVEIKSIVDDERAIKFALWFAEHCFHYQLEIYGDKIDALHKNAISP